MVSKGSRRGQSATALKQPPAVVIAAAVAHGMAGALDWRRRWAATAQARWEQAVHSVAVERVSIWLIISAISAASWIVCETIGGLAFLAAGVRLWTYEIVPVAWAITSPVIWGVVFLVMTPFMVAFGRVEAMLGWGGLRQIAARAAYLMAVGPIVEVLINEFFFKGILGRPLYVYDVLPISDGSGSLLSPLYYLTLYIHYPVTALVLRRVARR